MQTRPDYSSYHLHELEAALANIDESTNPEEAKIIRGYIEKGGYTYPKESEVAGVRFVSATYKWFLVSVLAVLFVANLYFLVVDHRIRSGPTRLNNPARFDKWISASWAMPPWAGAAS
jgi:hypothetical protein